MNFFDRALPLEEPPVRLWQEDPELFEGLDRRAQREAQLQAVAPALRVDPGPWSGRLEAVEDPSDHLGLLVIEGMLIRTVVVGRRSHSEVITSGDVIRPWEENEDSSAPSSATWTAAESTRLAVLNPAFLRWSCRWPALMSAIMGRAIRRSQSLALQLAITDVRRVDERILLLFWHLADRCGRVRADGVLLPLRVTHETLAELVGAQRPTVTSALQKLSRSGHIRRLPDKTWLLTPMESPLVTDAGPAPQTCLPAA